MAVAREYPDPRTLGPYGNGVAVAWELAGGDHESLLYSPVPTLEGDSHLTKDDAIPDFPNLEQPLAWHH